MKRRRSPVGWQAVLDSYVVYLSTHRGLSDGGASARSVLRRLVSFLEGRQVLSPETCTIDDLDAWIAVLVDARPMSSKTLGGYISVLRGFLKYLHGEGHMAARLWTGLDAPRIWQEATVPQHFSWKEVGQFISRVQSDPTFTPRDVALVWLMASAGLRSAEAARLKLPDIDWQAATVVLRLRKRARPLVLPLLPAVVAALRTYVETERPNAAQHEHVFLTDRGHPYTSGAALSHHIERLATKAGLGRGRAGRALRRGLGVRLLESGAGLGQIALMLGHDDARSTRVYLRASMEQLKDVADNYANLL